MKVALEMNIKKMIGGYKELWTFSVWMWLAYITVLYLTILFIFSNGDPFEIESKTVIWMSSYFIHDILVSFIDYLWEVRTNTFIIADCFGVNIFKTFGDT